MLSLLVVTFVLFSCPTSATFYKSNLTDFSQCNVYYARQGPVYTDFFYFEDTAGMNDSYLLDFHFSVLAVSDAHVLLAPSSVLNANDPVYEIVIGAGGNTFCDIRRKVKASVKTSSRIKGLLSPVDPRSFWLHITKDGVVELGREGEELAFISWTDPDPLPLKVFSFSTWRNIEAKWFYNCRRDEHIQQVQKQLTASERLRKDLLANYNPYVRPVLNESKPTVLLTTIKSNTFHLDEKRSVAEVNGQLNIVWTDEKMQWKAADYDGVDYVHIFRREIWQPDFYLYNAIEDGRGIFSDSMMVVHSDGFVEWNPPVNMKVWCDATDKGNWPKDIHECAFILTIWRENADIFLKFDVNRSEVHVPQSSEWNILDVTVRNTQPSAPNSLPIGEIAFQVQRQASTYYTIFYTPFIVVSFTMLASFWTSPFSHLKISLNCFHLMLSTIVLLSLGYCIPIHPERMPFLIALYLYSLIAGILSLTIAVIVINLSRNPEKCRVPNWLLSLLTSNRFQRVFCLSSVETSENYGKLQEFSGDSSKMQSIEQTAWIRLAMVMDRIAFLIYLPLFIYALYLHTKQ